MNTSRKGVSILLMTAVMVLMLLACNSMYANTPEIIPETGDGTAAQAIAAKSSNPASAYAQATIDSGRNQLLDLSRQATESNLNLAQTANAAAQATQVYIQQQKLALDFQATRISLNIDRAKATQQFLKQQSNLAPEATAAAQRNAEAATQSADQMIDTQTAQAQVVLNIQGSQTAQAAAALTAFPFTATPFAATQAAVLNNEYNQERQSFVNRIVNPMILILAVLDLILFVVGIVLIYRAFILTPEPHNIIPSEFRTADTSETPDENTIYIVTANADDLPITDWVNEVEHQLDTEERYQD